MAVWTWNFVNEYGVRLWQIFDEYNEPIILQNHPSSGLIVEARHAGNMVIRNVDATAM